MKKLYFLEICKPCEKSPTGRHEFYVDIPEGAIGKLRMRVRKWFENLGLSKRGYICKCPVCNKKDNVKIERIVEKQIKVEK